MTRDKNGALRLWSQKPERKGDCWVFPFMSDFSFKLDKKYFINDFILKSKKDLEIV